MRRSRRSRRGEVSWFAFDHLYSCRLRVPRGAARRVRAEAEDAPRHRSGNTGRWAIQCCTHDPDVRVTLLDLPGQRWRTRLRQLFIARHGLLGPDHGHPHRLPGITARRSRSALQPAIWMSQFLVSPQRFSEAATSSRSSGGPRRPCRETRTISLLDPRHVLGSARRTARRRSTVFAALPCISRASYRAGTAACCSFAADIRRCIDQAGALVASGSQRSTTSASSTRCAGAAGASARGPAPRERPGEATLRGNLDNPDPGRAATQRMRRLGAGAPPSAVGTRIGICVALRR